MKILLINKYFYHKGGAETVFFDTAELLKKKGHELVFFSMKHPKNIRTEYEKYFVSETDYEKPGIGDSLRASMNILYSFEAKNRLEKLLQEEKPDIAHLHNIYHQISPSILHSLKKNKVPVVMTLHDYKLVCGSYALIAGGKICEACKGRKYYNCFIKRCVKQSRLKSLLSTLEMYFHHRVLHVYRRVDAFISPSQFLKYKIEEMGFRGRIEYLPNFVEKEKYQPEAYTPGRSIAYFGRISKEKGISTLIDAVHGLDLNLKIIGDGPIKDELFRRVEVRHQPNVQFLGYKNGADLVKEINSCQFVVLPSEWYENNPRSILEAFALGKPVIGSRVGGIPELIREGETGYVFAMGDPLELKKTILRLINSPEDIRRMGRNAMVVAESEFTASKHYERLMEIYKSISKN
jgi:glycosyltransferase involved in cell wall biosynthesis